jgi:glycosyltransferase involved in cell wall biosynthesis
MVRGFVTGTLLQKLTCPYLVHLEDNEEHIVEKTYGSYYVKNDEIDVPLHMSHPIKYKEFISNSSGVTALTENLLEFKPEELPGQVIWPGYDSIFSDLEVNSDLKNKLGIERNNTVIVYMGNVHYLNRREVHSLYLAVYILNRHGIPVTLIRTGKDYVPLVSEDLSVLKENCIELGYLPRNELPDLLSIADFLVQPGSPNEFNDYRFPSKLPDYLVSGKPVILPNTNIGKSMDSGGNCMLLGRGDAIDIAKNIEWLLGCEEKAIEVGRKGEEFAKKNLSWGLAASKVEKLYCGLVEG